MNKGRGMKRKAPEGVQMKPLVQTHFKEVMDGAYYDWIDPHACVPFTRTRTIVESGVRRLMAIFDASYNGDRISGGGIACGSDTPIVVKLTGTLRNYFVEYFKSQGKSEYDAKQRFNSRKEWFGIIDGEHSFLAIIRLIESKKRWSGYSWFVTIVQYKFSIDKYGQLARMQNERHNSKFFVEYTFFDIISNLRTEYEQLLKIQKRASA